MGVLGLSSSSDRIGNEGVSRDKNTVNCSWGGAAKGEREGLVLAWSCHRAFSTVPRATRTSAMQVGNITNCKQPVPFSPRAIPSLPCRPTICPSRRRCYFFAHRFSRNGRPMQSFIPATRADAFVRRPTATRDFLERLTRLKIGGITRRLQHGAGSIDEKFMQGPCKNTTRARWSKTATRNLPRGGHREKEKDTVSSPVSAPARGCSTRKQTAIGAYRKTPARSALPVGGRRITQRAEAVKILRDNI